MMDELEQRSRGNSVLGVVRSVDDSGPVQVLTVETHDQVVRTEVEVMSIHGLATNPGPGATALLLAIEDDQGHMVAMPCALFGYRFGSVAAGGTVLYDAAGNRLALNNDGTALLTTAGLTTIMVQSLLIQSQAGTKVRGPTVFEDDVVFRGNVTVGGNLSVGGSLVVGGATSRGPVTVPPDPF